MKAYKNLSLKVKVHHTFNEAQERCWNDVYICYNLFLFSVYENFACMYVDAYHMCAWHLGRQRRCHMPGPGVLIPKLGAGNFEPWSSKRAASAVNPRVITPVPQNHKCVCLFLHHQGWNLEPHTGEANALLLS